jgi:integrase/recombinase XerD
MEHRNKASRAGLSKTPPVASEAQSADAPGRIYSIGERFGEDLPALLNPYLEKWTKHMTVLQGLSPKTVAAYIPKIREFYEWRKTDGNSDTVEFTREDIEGYLEWCFYKGNQNFTRNTKLTAIRKWTRFLLYERRIGQDVTSDIPHPRVLRRFPQIFTKDEVLRLFSVIDIRTEKGLRDLVVFVAAAFLGLRIGEIVNLNLGDIVEADGQKQGSLYFQIINSKFQNSRVVSLWKAPALFVRQLLVLRTSQGARLSDPFIVTYTRHGRFTGERISRDTLSYSLKYYAREAGIRKRVFFHMFRSSHATALRSIANYDLPAIASRLGHRSVETTAQRYFASWERVKRTYPSLAAYWREFSSYLMQNATKEKKGNSKEIQ